MRGGEHFMINKTQETQKALEQFVEGVILACQSSLVEDALKKQLFMTDDITNIYRPFDGKLIDPSTCIRCKEKQDFLDSETGECEECFEENQTPQEIYEWWLVTPWFSKKLLLEGQPVLENNYGMWWGRCTTGQAIVLDDVVEIIYHDIMG